MVTVYDVEPSKLIDLASEELKKVDAVTPPEWVPFVKTGAHNTRVPENPEWWYARAASILRKIYISPVGVDRLRTVYGGRKNKGYKPEKRVNASGNIIRKCIQQLETAGLVTKVPKGRSITPAGQKFLDNLAYKVFVEAEAKAKVTKAAEDKIAKEKAAQAKIAEAKVAEEQAKAAKAAGAKVTKAADVKDAKVVKPKVADKTEAKVSEKK